MYPRPSTMPPPLAAVPISPIVLKYSLDVFLASVSTASEIFVTLAALSASLSADALAAATRNSSTSLKIKTSGTNDSPISMA